MKFSNESQIFLMVLNISLQFPVCFSWYLSHFQKTFEPCIILKIFVFFQQFWVSYSYQKNSWKKHSVLIIKYNLVNKHSKIKISIKRNGLNMLNRITMINTIQLKDNIVSTIVFFLWYSQLITEDSSFWKSGPNINDLGCIFRS